MARTVLALYGPAQLGDVAELVVSELVTNAVVHTEGPSRLQVDGGEERVRIAVWDTSPRIPPPLGGPPAASVRPVPDERLGGRGLGLVGVWARDWGAYTVGEDGFGAVGKVVWVELAWGRGDFAVAA
ncbi:ATP-binding protein [Streptomyces sp. JJ38]|uniref:ATP-binding protein n=1 Tax=Streptomyces sp. JJ38 TaxID=2738128 RepID=UPI001C58CD79|nr:ATP-binding protein [Streptomyces sp. JJ38]MBW1597438.1 ATP-binding protein [Streptomyces sp. JJ38]